MGGITHATTTNATHVDVDSMFVHVIRYGSANQTRRSRHMGEHSTCFSEIRYGGANQARRSRHMSDHSTCFSGGVFVEIGGLGIVGARSPNQKTFPGALSAMSGESLRVIANRAQAAPLACCPTWRNPRVGSQYSLYTFCTNFRAPLSDVATAVRRYIW